ncbi:MAG: DUF4358 domain-containing protein [Lachnospiraceae bacterium]|nr:DUF4358 domain-containing protein [Lachnospiraceae bacterium]
MNAVKKLRITLAGMFLCLFLFLALSKGRGTREDLDLQALSQEMLQLMSDGGSIQAEGAMKLKSLYGLAANDYRQAVLYVPVSNMDAAELLLIRCRDESQTEQVRAAMERRIEEQIGKFESYGVEQMAIINKAVVDIQGPWCLYVVSRSSEEVEDLFVTSVRK